MSGVVIFDAFGTLADIVERRSPYRKLMQWMRENGRPPQSDDAKRVMSQTLSLAETAQLFGMNPPAALMTSWEADLATELNSIRLFADVSAAITRLRNAGYRIGLCSNLAAPYSAPVAALLPTLDIYAWSYEVGLVKPEPAIYRHLVDRLDCTPDDVLFVGDTPIADLVGPLAFGMAARLIDRKKGQSLNEVLGDLY